MKNFKQLKIWQKGFSIAVHTYRYSATMPKVEQFTLCSQMTKAAISIPSNIAEGSSRASAKDQNRFVEIALGSSYELETQQLIAQAVNLGDQNLCKTLSDEVCEEQKMMIGFKKSLTI